MGWFLFATAELKHFYYKAMQECELVIIWLAGTVLCRMTLQCVAWLSSLSAIELHSEWMMLCKHASQVAINSFTFNCFPSFVLTHISVQFAVHQPEVSAWWIYWQHKRDSFTPSMKTKSPSRRQAIHDCQHSNTCNLHLFCIRAPQENSDEAFCPHMS